MSASPAKEGHARVEAALLTGLCLALVCGFAEAAILGFRRHILGAFIWTLGPFAWMTPLGYLILFTPLAGALALVAVMRSRWMPPTIPMFVFTLLGSFGLLSMLSMLRAIHPLALLLLAAGLAAVTGRLIARRTDMWLKILGRIALFGSALWIGLLGVDLARAAAARAAAERAAVRRSSSVEVEADGAPNILLIIWDTVRAQNLSLYGYQRETTPFLERFASRGVVFDRAFSTAPWTLPSHGTMFTGRYPHQFSASWLRPLDDALPTVAEVLRDRGYRTAAFTSNWYYTDREKGLAQGFELYVDHRRSAAQFILNTTLGQTIPRWLMASMRADGLVDFVQELGYVPPFGRWPDRRYGPDINREFLTWLRERPRRPYFAFLNYMDAHTPYFAPREVQAQFDAEDPRRDGYDAAIHYLDQSIESLITELDSMGELDGTLVVITSDHGEMLGEHDVRGHGNSLYLPELHVPLLLVGRGRVPAGIRLSDPVSLRDLATTLLDLTDAGDTALPGRSLTRLWSVEPSERPSYIIAEVDESNRSPEHSPVTRGGIRSLIMGRYHYIAYGDGGVQLFDYEADPLEQNDLSMRSGADSLLQALERELDAARSGNR